MKKIKSLVVTSVILLSSSILNATPFVFQPVWDFYSPTVAVQSDASQCGFVSEVYAGKSYFTEGESEVFNFNFQEQNTSSTNSLDLINDVYGFNPNGMTAASYLDFGSVEFVFYDVDGWNPYDMENLQLDISMTIDNIYGNSITYGLEELDGWYNFDDGIYVLRHEFTIDELTNLNQLGVSDVSVRCTTTGLNNYNDFILKGVAVSASVPEANTLALLTIGLFCFVAVVFSGKKAFNS